jgi:hypothetical protein
VTLSVTAIRLLPDRGARVFYAAWRRMVFGLSSGESCDSPAIICHRAKLSTIWKPGNQESNRRFIDQQDRH